MARDVDPDDERWEVTADHPLYGTEVTLDLERRTVTGRVRDVWKFRGEARTRRRPDPRQRRDREHCSRQVELLRNFHSKSSARGFKSAPSVPTGKALQVTPHPRLGGRSQEERLDTLLFSARLDKRYPRERQLRSGRPPRRAGLQHATMMTLRRSTRPATTNRFSTGRSGATSRGSRTLTVEEERARESIPSRARSSRTERIATRDRNTLPITKVSVCVGAFNTLHYCYHSDDTHTHTPRVSATSLVAPSLAVESGGVPADV